MSNSNIIPNDFKVKNNCEKKKLINNALQHIYDHIPIKNYIDCRTDINKFRDTFSYSAPEIINYRWSQFLELLNYHFPHQEDTQKNPEWINKITTIVLETNSKLTMLENTI